MPKQKEKNINKHKKLVQLSQWIGACRQFTPVQSVIGVKVTHCRIEKELFN